MLRTSIPGLDANLLRAQAQAELDKLCPAPAPESAPSRDGEFHPFSAAIAPPLPGHPGSPATLDDLLALHGREFLDRSWVALTGTRPDPGRLAAYLEAMQSGELNKVEVLEAIRKTSEGRAAAVPLPGLGWRLLPFRCARLPVVGPLLRLGVALYRLPEHWRRVNVLWARHETVPASCPAPSAPPGVPPQPCRPAYPSEPGRGHPPPPPDLDELYLAFENTFRGSRAEIKQRLSAYLPYLDQVRTANPDAPVLDIGCGRGEWLELLREQGHPAQGVDLNRAAADLCAGLGLEVAAQDAVNHLRSLPCESLSAVTAFHLIEHLPLESIVLLLDAAYHALVPGGILILETPNPENLLVGACSFHRDPTHLRPIHPETALFLLTQRNFRDVRYSGLSPFAAPDRDQVPEGFLRRLFFAPQDYMIVGYK